MHGRPFLTYLLDQLRAAGVRDVVLCTGHRSDQIRETIGTSYQDISLRYSSENRPAGNGRRNPAGGGTGRLRATSGLNGDSCVHTPLDAFHRWHLARASSFTGALLLTWTENAARFGTVELGPRAAIRSFREKHGEPCPGWINGGVYSLRRSLVESIPPNRNVSLENEAFPSWVRSGLGGYTTRARLHRYRHA